jgi:hypothetical protein
MKKIARIVFACLCLCGAAASAADDLGQLLTRTSARVADSLEKFSEVKCTEKVKQEKLSPDGKVTRDIESTYDYLAIFSGADGDLSLNESRLPAGETKTDKKNTPLLVTNGFATLFLVFHPYYAGSFQFTALADEMFEGQKVKKVVFHYIAGSKSPGVLALRGREYPLQLSGTAWIEPETGAILKMDADIGSTLEDVGLKTLHSEVEYSPVPFRELKTSYWFPKLARVEVETARQHWRNTHSFTDYLRFSVSTDEKVASK